MKKIKIIKDVDLAKTIKNFQRGADVIISTHKDFLEHLESVDMEESTRELLTSMINYCRIIEINNRAELMKIDYFDLNQKINSELLNTNVCLAICFDFNENSGGYLIAIDNARYTIFQILMNTVIGIESGYLNEKNEVCLMTDYCFSATQNDGIYELGDYISFYNRYVEHNSLLN